MDLCAEGINQGQIDYEDGRGSVKLYSCTYDDVLYSTDGAGEEQPTLVNHNLANGIVMYYDPQPLEPEEPEDPEPPQQTESCATTLYFERDCEAGISHVNDLVVELTGETQEIPVFMDGMSVRSILLREQSDIDLYEEERFGGDIMHVENQKMYEDGVDGCVCVNLMKRDGGDHDIRSVRYTQSSAIAQ